MFKKSLAVSFALVALIAGCDAEPSPAEIAADASSSVVRIESSTRSGDIFGSGFVVAGPEGVVVTAYHVVQDAESIRVLVGGAESTSSSVAELLVFDEVLDLALLRVPPLGDGIELSSSTLSSGSHVLAMGYPLGLEGDVSITQGIVSRQIESDGQHYVQHDAEILQGNSGGPLLGEDGKVIGVNILVIIDVETVAGLNIAVHVLELERLMESAGLSRGVSVALPSPTPKPEATPTATPLPQLLDVIDVIDGGTIDTSIGRVGLFGVLKPAKGGRCYEEATSFLASLLGEQVHLENGPRLWSSSGERLAYVFDPLGSSIDAQMIEGGYVLAWTLDGQYADMLTGLEQSAKVNGIGCRWN
jgi:S1-C subfamily serine protease